ncbi:MAG: tetratricopeptide repeat protein, partial [Chloroflexi bacterium]|nr:tetratricopeptide repeat protein [Chloroflexota bacterium]
MSDDVFWNEIGNIYLKIGSHEEAIAAYTKAIELNPDSGWLYCNLGQVYFLTGNFSRALVLFQKSICFMDTPENQAVVWNKIGDAYRALKDIENAIRAYKKADALDMRALPPGQSADTHSADSANLRETLETEKSVPNTNNPLSALLKAASPSELSFENPALADGFQPVNVGKRYEEICLQSDLTETKPSISSTPNRTPDQDIDALSVENNQNTARFIPDAENDSLLRKKPIIVIPDPDEITGTTMKEEIASSSPEPIRNSTATRVDEIRDGKSKDHSNKCPSVGNLEEILAKVNVYE